MAGAISRFARRSLVGLRYLGRRPVQAFDVLQHPAVKRGERTILVPRARPSSGGASHLELNAPVAAP